MGKEDVYESDYLENPEIFADLVNGALYQGRHIVKAEDLSEQDGELRSIANGSIKKTVRDKVRLWNGTLLAVLSVENQTKVDYSMVVRTMLTESMAYDRQRKKLSKKLIPGKDAVTSDEFISGMRKEDKFIPVITLVVYYGKEKPWDGARTLYELLDIQGTEEKIIPYISNYRLNLFDFHEHDDFGQFHTELKPFFEFLRYSDEKELLKEKLNLHKEEYEKLSGQAKVLLAKLTNIRNIPGVGKKAFEKGEFSMCNAFEDMKEEGKIEGKIEGRAEELIEMICKKLLKNKSAAVIAAELEKELPIVENIIRIQRQLGSYDAGQIYGAMQTDSLR